jgi:transposase
VIRESLSAREKQITAHLAAGMRIANVAHELGLAENTIRKSLTFYQRFGFEITGEVQLGPDGPSMWTLWREGSGTRNANAN